MTSDKHNISSDNITTVGVTKKKTIKESPVPPPRELILASPDLVLSSRSRLSLDTFQTYFECLGPKQILIENKRTR